MQTVVEPIDFDCKLTTKVTLVNARKQKPYLCPLFHFNCLHGLYFKMCHNKFVHYMDQDMTQDPQVGRKIIGYNVIKMSHKDTWDVVNISKQLHIVF